MRKKAKRMKLVTAPLTWGDFIRGKAVKGEDGGREKGDDRGVRFGKSIAGISRNVEESLLWG